MATFATYVPTMPRPQSYVHNLARQYKAPPAAADLRVGAVYDQVTGTYVGALPDFPANSHVRAGVEFDNGGRIGALDLPSVGNVKGGVVFDGGSKTGTYAPDLPLAEELMLGVTRGVNDPGGPVIGTYAGEPLYPPQQIHFHLAPIPQRLEVSLA